MFGYDRLEVVAGSIMIVILLLVVLIGIKALILFHEKRKISGRWVEFYKRKGDGGVDLISKDKELVDSIPYGSQCISTSSHFDSIGYVIEMVFLTKGERRKGPFYVNSNIGKKIKKIFIDRNCCCDF